MTEDFDQPDYVTEYRLWESMSALAQLYQQAPIGLALLDRDLRFLRINERMAAINGHPVDEHIGRPIREVLPELADTLEPLMQRVLDTGELGVDMEIVGTTPADPANERYWISNYYPLFGDVGDVRGVACIVREVTAERVAQKELAESEARHRTIFESSPTALFLMDGETGRHVECNAQCLEFLDVPYDKFIGMTQAEVSPECQPNEACSSTLSAEYLQRALDGEMVEFTWCYHDRSVGECIAKVRYVPFPTEVGSMILGSVVDVTDRDQVQRELERQVLARTLELANSNRNLTIENSRYAHLQTQQERIAEQFRTLVQTIPYGIEEIDCSGVITVANAGLHAQYGYADGELLGKSTFDLVATDNERAGLVDFLRFLVEEQPTPTLYFGKKRRKNGEVIDVQVAWNYKRDSAGHVVGFISVISDITEQIRVEGALVRSEEQLRAEVEELELLYRTAPLGLCHMDRDLRYRRCNDKLAAINGIPAADHLGRTLREIVPEIADAIEAVYARVLATGEPVIDVVASGTTRAEPTMVHHFSACYYPTFSEDGKVTGVSSIVQDITARKNAEDALQRAHDKLEERVRERTLELEGANLALRTEVSERLEAERRLRRANAEILALKDRLEDDLAVLRGGYG